MIVLKAKVINKTKNACLVNYVPDEIWVALCGEARLFAAYDLQGRKMGYVESSAIDVLEGTACDVDAEWMAI